MGCRAVDLKTGPSKGLFAPFLHVLLDELFGVLLEHVVDLVEQGVKLLLELLALLGYLGRRLHVRLLGFLLAVRTPLLAGSRILWITRRSRWRESQDPSTSPGGCG